MPQRDDGAPAQHPRGRRRARREAREPLRLRQPRPARAATASPGAARELVRSRRRRPARVARARCGGRGRAHAPRAAHRVGRDDDRARRPHYRGHPALALARHRALRARRRAAVDGHAARARSRAGPAIPRSCALGRAVQRVAAAPRPPLRPPAAGHRRARQRRSVPPRPAAATPSRWPPAASW